MTPLTEFETKVRALAALREKATEGAWRIHATSDYVLENEDGTTVGMLGGISNLVNNGEFIAQAANDTAEICAMALKLVEVVRVQEEALGNIVGLKHHEVVSGHDSWQQIAREALRRGREILGGEK